MDGACEVEEGGSWRRRYVRVIVEEQPFIVLRNGFMGAPFGVDVVEPHRLCIYGSRTSSTPVFGFALANIVDVKEVTPLTFAITTADENNPLKLRVKRQRDVNRWIVGLRKMCNLVCVSERKWPLDAGPEPAPLLPAPRECPPSPDPTGLAQTYQDPLEHSL